MLSKLSPITKEQIAQKKEQEALIKKITKRTIKIKIISSEKS